MTAKRKRPKVAKSKMWDAFKAQAGDFAPLSMSKFTKLLGELEHLESRRAVLASAVERSERMAECRTWFYYGWQACERSKKP